MSVPRYIGTADRPRYNPTSTRTPAPAPFDSQTLDARLKGAAAAGAPTNTQEDVSALNDLFMARPPVNPDQYKPRSSGGGGGGYGGGYAAPDPRVQGAYKQLWQEQLGRAVNLGQGYDKYEDSLRKAYDPGRYDAVYDTAKTGVQDASKAGLERLGPILQALQDRAAQGRTDVSQAYAQGDARLADLEGQYLARMASADNGVNDVLGNFDAGSIAPSGEQNLTNLMANARFANARMGTVADAALADRPAVYGGLNADVQSGITRDETGLMNRIAMQRAQTTAGAESQLQQALAQAGLQRMTAEQQRQAEQDQLRIQLAQLGLTPPTAFVGPGSEWT